MVNVIRLYLSRGQEIQVVDLELHEVRKRKRELQKDGWTVYHAVRV